jgi:hypothetical protein
LLAAVIHRPLTKCEVNTVDTKHEDFIILYNYFGLLDVGSPVLELIPGPVRSKGLRQTCKKAVVNYLKSMMKHLR